MRHNDTAAYGLQAESALEDSGKDSAALVDIGKEDHKCAQYVCDSHEGNQLLGNRSNPLQSADDD